MRLSTISVCFVLIAGSTVAPALARSTPRVGPYRGLASWVDIYDRKPWKDPGAVIGRLRSRGVKTLYLQTSNYQRHRDVLFRSRVSRFLDAAHGAGIKVVAWYVPSFKRPRVDLRRSMAAINFQSRAGNSFDSYAMDIEADNVRNISKRNDRLLSISSTIRERVGPDYPLGAIIPDPKTQRYWPHFPYKRVANIYDVFLPMSYFTFRTKGWGRVYGYTKDSLAIIRRETADPDVPIHIIGGLAGDASAREVKAFARAVREKRAIGASLYDLPLMTPSDWSQLKHMERRKTRPERKAAPPVPDPRIAGRIVAGRIV